MNETDLDLLAQIKESLPDPAHRDELFSAIHELAYLRGLRRTLLQIIEDDTQQLCDILQRERENAVRKPPINSITSNGRYSTRSKP